MLDWNDLQYILALDEGKTMKRAADLLQTNATTVSRHIKALSVQMDTVLFTRDKDGLCHLTPQGKQLLTIAREMRERLRSLDVPTNGDDVGEIIKITSLEFLLTHFLAPNLADVSGVGDGTRVHLIGSDRRLSLAFGEADLALRFGRPVEGQLIASKVAEVAFHAWSARGCTSNDWVGLDEELDWTPEMQFGFAHFGRAPAFRVSSFSAARNACLSLKLNVIAPAQVICPCWENFQINDVEPVTREVWSVIHESRKLDKRLATVRAWAKDVVQSGLSLHKDPEMPSGIDGRAGLTLCHSVTGR